MLQGRTSGEARSVTGKLLAVATVPTQMVPLAQQQQAPTVWTTGERWTLALALAAVVGVGVYLVTKGRR